jgi:succinate dehydrogenase / fumarate reductase cytochrome b subunit
MSKEGRPLSPHLTIYRWPITMLLSILHRITGVALAVGLIAFVFWLEAIAYEAVSYDLFNEIMRSVIGKIALLGWLFSFFFHLSNGIRHLIWDTGRLFEKRQADLSAWLVLVAAVVLTACYWIIL